MGNGKECWTLVVSHKARQGLSNSHALRFLRLCESCPLVWFCMELYF